MNLELQIYETAMRVTQRLWGAARSRDAIHDAVAEAYTQHLSRARRTGTVRRELGSFVAKTAGEVLRGRRSRGAHEQASDWRHGPGDERLDPTAWLEAQGVGSEDALIELLDAEPPAVLPTPEEGTAALTRLLAEGWRAIRIAEAIEVHQSTVCLWKQGLGISPSSAARLVALVGQSPPRRQRKPMGPRRFPGGELDPDVIERALRRGAEEVSGGTARCQNLEGSVSSV